MPNKRINEEFYISTVSEYKVLIIYLALLIVVVLLFFRPGDFKMKLISEVGIQILAGVFLLFGLSFAFMFIYGMTAWVSSFLEKDWQSLREFSFWFSLELLASILFFYVGYRIANRR